MIGATCPDKPCTQIAHPSCRNIGCKNVRAARKLLGARGAAMPGGTQTVPGIAQHTR